MVDRCACMVTIASFNGVQQRYPYPAAWRAVRCAEGPDGHDYLAIARSRGAAGALVEHESMGGLLKSWSRTPCVASAARAWLAHALCSPRAGHHRQQRQDDTEMIAAILARRGAVLATRGNLNNDIGVPLTLARLRDEPYAVIEIVPTTREIDYLEAEWRSRFVAVLNNAGRAHLERFRQHRGAWHAPRRDHQCFWPVACSCSTPMMRSPVAELVEIRTAHLPLWRIDGRFQPDRCIPGRPGRPGGAVPSLRFVVRRARSS